MPYTPPTGDAVIFSWENEGSYVPPSGSSVNFKFGTKFTTSGISSTAFGVPRATYDQVGLASGIPSGAAFGSPSADFQTRHIASGILSTALFGTPSAKYAQIGSTSGFKTTRFGRPEKLISNYAPSIGEGTRFGTPKCKVRFVGQVESFPVSTHFGVPTGHMNTIGKAESIRLCEFGVPAAIYTQHGVAVGFSSTRFGTPRRPRDESLDTLFVFQRANRVDVWSEL